MQRKTLYLIVVAVFTIGFSTLICAQDRSWDKTVQTAQSSTAPLPVRAPNSLKRLPNTSNGIPAWPKPFRAEKNSPSPHGQVLPSRAHALTWRHEFRTKTNVRSFYEIYLRIFAKRPRNQRFRHGSAAENGRPPNRTRRHHYDHWPFRRALGSIGCLCTHERHHTVLDGGSSAVPAEAHRPTETVAFPIRHRREPQDSHIAATARYLVHDLEGTPRVQQSASVSNPISRLTERFAIL
jgi:hypothetical protein